jgi:hypothetical protein
LLGIPFGRLLTRGKHEGVGLSWQTLSHHFLNLISLRGENEGAVLTTGRSRRRAGAGAWSIQMETARLSEQGEDVIFLTVRHQDLVAWESVIDAPSEAHFEVLD